MKRIVVGLLLGWGSACFSASVSADDNDLHYDVIHLSASARSEVANDLMTVNLNAQAQGKDTSKLASEINNTMNWALSQLKSFPDVTARTRDYQTYPQYERNGSKIRSWTATQTIELKSDNFEQAGKAIQLLQSRLQVQGMQLSAKPATREQAEDKLINEALDAFKRRALLVQNNMDASEYRIVNLSINTNNGGGPRPMHRGASYDSAMSVESAPAIEAGTSSVTVRVDGQIQLD